MSSADSPAALIRIGIVVAFALLIAAVWASGASVATSLALTGGLVLLGVGLLSFVVTRPPREDPAGEQGERMQRSVP